MDSRMGESVTTPETGRPPGRERERPLTYTPTRQEMDDLINQASDHPLGLQFLLRGSLDAVAATFQVHAFVVEAAREQVRPSPG